MEGPWTRTQTVFTVLAFVVGLPAVWLSVVQINESRQKKAQQNAPIAGILNDSQSERIKSQGTANSKEEPDRNRPAVTTHQHTLDLPLDPKPAASPREKVSELTSAPSAAPADSPKDPPPPSNAETTGRPHPLPEPIDMLNRPPACELENFSWTSEKDDYVATPRTEVMFGRGGTPNCITLSTERIRVNRVGTLLVTAIQNGCEQDVDIGLNVVRDARIDYIFGPGYDGDPMILRGRTYSMLKAHTIPAKGCRLTRNQVFRSTLVFPRLRYVDLVGGLRLTIPSFDRFKLTLLAFCNSLSNRPFYARKS